MDNRPSDGKTEKRKVNTGASGSGVKGSAKDKKKPFRSGENPASFPKKSKRRKGGRNTPVEEQTKAKLRLNKPQKKEPMAQEEIDREAEKILDKPKKEAPKKPDKPLAPAKKPMSPYMRRLRQVLLGVITLTVLAAVCVVLSLTVFFKIEEITVEGETRYDTDKIIASSEIVLGDNLLLCKTSPGVEKIKDDFAYIEEVSIDKHLFNKITITVAEATPASEVESGGKFIVLSQKGKIIEINDQSKYNVPTVLGASLKNVKLASYIEYGDENLKKYLDKIIVGIKDYGIRDIRTVDLKDHSRIMLIREKGFKVIIGGFENLDYKLRTAAAILNENVKDTDLGTLDVSLASPEGGKSYLKLGEEASKPVEESSKPSEKSKTEESSQSDQDRGDTGTDDSGETGENTGDDGSYDNTGDGGNTDDTGDNGGYDDGGDTGDNGGYDDGGDTGDNGGYDDGGDTGDNGGYDDGGDTGDNGGYEDGTWE